MRDDDELRLRAHLPDHAGKSIDVRFVQRSIDFVENAKRTGLETEQSNEQRQCRKRLLSAGQQQNILQFLARRLSDDFDSGIGFLGALAFTNVFWVSVAWVAVAVTGVNGARALFWSIPPRFLTGMAAAGGLAFINSVGVMGGFVGPTIMGFLVDQTGSYSAGLLALSGFLVASSIIAWSLKRWAPGE